MSGSTSKRPSVLVVDDNQDSADVLGMLVKFFGATVHVAYDGPSALHAIETLQPDVALVDIGMPRMDGFELARRAREVASSRPIRLIALSGWCQEEDFLQSKSAGFDHYLVKP